MKRSPWLVVLAGGGLLTAPWRVGAISPDPASQPPQSTTPALTADRLTGGGRCQVHFGGKGQVASVVVVKSTGSKVLDNNTVASAQKYWRGLPNTTITVPMKYSAAPVLAKTGGTIEYKTPVPDYPRMAEVNQLDGRSIVQVIFDLQGHPVYAGILKSSGSELLDKHTTSFVLANWSSSGGEESMLTMPVSYILRNREIPRAVTGSLLPPMR